MSKIFGIVLTIIVVALLGGAVWMHQNRVQDTIGDDSAWNDYMNKQVTIEGTLTCLPHKDTSGPTTLECAFGLVTDAGQYYAFDTSRTDLEQTGDRVRVTGVVTPVESLSANQWQNYNIVGIITVASVQKI
ncbi:MAG TPA: hypothetical protein VLB02_01050 [Candidatus Paceibacterota bacterium]|nr:hypothetical protein [Candidatus Paceibacterota bacterium]